jgi:exonuclease SbcC
MKITIKKIKIENFKGCKNLEINLNGNLNIEGANATGKSTVADAFTWCLFGKNASQEKDFNVKNTVDTSLNQAEHSVEITLIASDGLNTQTTTLRRTYREKWSKIKGSDTATYTGNETLFYWNEVPMAAKDYAAKVELILPESLFKLLTNPMYFNSLKWNERRAMLMNLVQESGFDNSPYAEMLAMLSGNKTIEELKREVAASKKKAKEALELIPARKDELLRLKVEIDPDLPGQIATLKA